MWPLPIERIVLITLLAAVSVGFSPSKALASTCEVEKTIPQNQVVNGSGSATAEYDGVTSVNSGQGIYVTLPNQNLLGVSYELTVAENSNPDKEICTDKAISLPKTSVPLSGAIFGEPPIGWKVAVAIGAESDGGVITYNSTPSNSVKSNAVPWASGGGTL
ncbi:hypothetical protein P8935_18445 [Telmatobacter sp. DSM 110680]|uniref:Uncharacterized protein n=1 Tax=Telmatobacter sp. DSM 110680 TaxID=3036704 RepID=A0AAU7DGN3_9BACT